MGKINSNPVIRLASNPEFQDGFISILFPERRPAAAAENQVIQSALNTSLFRTSVFRTRLCKKNYC
jgi:hypothetical protein